MSGDDVLTWIVRSQYYFGLLEVATSYVRCSVLGDDRRRNRQGLKKFI